MSQELLYTSAPEGLNPSDQGFCTVACTQGMPRNLKEVLENLSGYRQADQPPHPVNFSHLIHTIGGKRFQILSRVSDYEKDYSGRTNKLAHHVALTIDELPPSGPAALFTTPLFQTKWDGQTRWIPQGPVLPPASAYQGPCPTWDAITGDAGWAGLLAESAADGSQRPMYVIFSPNQDTMALVREALGVLPREKAWTTSFSTYFTKLPAGVDCLWRFVLDGSPEAQQARAASHSRVIDLVELERSRRKAPAGNSYVEAARAGRVVAVEAPSIISPAGMHSAPSTMADTVAVPSAPSSPFASTNQAAVPASPFGQSTGETQKPSKSLIILGGVTAVLVIGVGVLVYSMLTPEIPPTINASEPDSKKRESRPRSKNKFVSEKQKKKNELAQKTVPPKFVARVNEPKPEPMSTVPEVDTKPKFQGPWDKDLAKLNGYLPLPQTSGSLNAFANPNPVVLTEIHVGDPKDIDLIIHSPNGNSKTIAEKELQGFILQTSDEIEPDGPSRRKWTVQRKLVGQLTLDGTKKLDVGFFEVSNQKLKFLWKANPPKGYQSLQYCLLEIRNEDDNQFYKFRLSDPKEVSALSYDLSQRVQNLFLETKTGAVENPKAVFLDMTVFANGKPVGSRKQLQVDETEKISFPQKGLEVDFTFQHDEKKGPYLEAKAFTKLRMVVDGNDKSKPDPKKPIGRIEGLRRLREDVDQLLIENRRLNINRTDLDRIQKEAKTIGDQLAGALNLKVHRQKVKNLTAEIGREKDANRRASLESQRNKHQKEINKYTDRIQVVADWVSWAESMKPYVEDLGKSTQVSYSIYTVIDGKKIFLARSAATPRPDESGKGKSRNKNDAPQNKDREKDSPEQRTTSKVTASK